MLEDLDLAGPDFADELATSAPLRSFLADLARLAFPAGSPADRRVNCTMRVINGPDLDEHPLWFHFDATVVTMVIPVVIPDADRGQSGELVIAPKSQAASPPGRDERRRQARRAESGLPAAVRQGPRPGPGPEHRCAATRQRLPVLGLPLVPRDHAVRSRIDAGDRHRPLQGRAPGQSAAALGQGRLPTQPSALTRRRQSGVVDYATRHGLPA